MKTEPQEIEVEVLPGRDYSARRSAGQGRKEGPGLSDPIIDLVARLMDSVFVIPGTRIRFGLDPLLGFLPGIGSPFSSFVSLFLLTRSAQYRVPHVVLARMVLNILINAVLDAVPIVGDTISIFFRSNAMNYELLRKHAGTRVSTKQDWIFVGGIIGGAVLVLVMAWVGFLVILAHLLRAVGHVTSTT